MIKDMKALVLHKPGDLRYEAKWPVPEVRDGWILVKTRYSGVCGSDLPRIMETGGYHHPFICGHEFCGTVYNTSSSSFRHGGSTMHKNFKSEFPVFSIYCVE